LLLAAGPYYSGRAQCNNGCTTTITEELSNGYFSVSEGKLCVPEGITFNGTIDIRNGAIVENCGTITGEIFLNGGTLINNGEMTPSDLALNSGLFENYDDLLYSKDIATADSGLIINNFGVMEFEKDVLLTATRLKLFGNMKVRDLNIQPGSTVLLYGQSILDAQDIELYDSMMLVNPTNKVMARNLTVNPTAYLEANGGITTERDLVLKGLLITNEDMLIGRFFDLDTSAIFSLATNTHTYVAEKVENNAAGIIVSGTMRVNGPFNNNVTTTLLHTGKIFTEDLTNRGALNGAGIGTRAVRVAQRSVNEGALLGFFDFCDSTSETGDFDVNNGAAAVPTITFCTFALPVKLVSFTATLQDNFVTLNWTTASEWNNSHFEVEVMENGKDWVTVGKVTGHGTSTEERNYVFNTMLDPATTQAF